MIKDVFLKTILVIEFYLYFQLAELVSKFPEKLD